MIQAGDPIPSFELAADPDGVVKSSDLIGTRFVIYFYPKDDTPG